MQEGFSFEICVFFFILLSVAPALRLMDQSEGSASLISLIVLCCFWPHLGCNPSTWSLQVVPTIIKDKIRREPDSGNPILLRSFSYVILLAVFSWTVVLSSRSEVLWSCLGDFEPLWPHSFPLFFIIMKRVLGDPNVFTRERSLGELYASREFYFFLNTPTREKI